MNYIHRTTSKKTHELDSSFTIALNVSASRRDRYKLRKWESRECINIYNILQFKIIYYNLLFSTPI